MRQVEATFENKCWNNLNEGHVYCEKDWRSYTVSQSIFLFSHECELFPNETGTSRRKKLDTLNTPIEVTTFIMMGLSQWSNKQEIPYEEIPVITGTTWGTQLLHAIQEQDGLGWDKMHRGFMSKYWQQCMDNYYKDTGLHTETVNGERWTQQLHTSIINYCLKLWDKQNNFLHGGHTKSSRLQRCENLEHKVQQLYKRYRGGLPRKYKSLFHLPVELRVCSGIQHMELWVQQATLLLNKYDTEKGLQIKHVWVKGHQNETKQGTPIFGPFPQAVQLNIKMDLVANRGCNLPSIQPPLFSHTKLAIYTEKRIMATNIESYLYDKVNGKQLHQYVGEKYGLEEHQIESIDWYALGSTLKTYSTFKQRKTIQMIYDW